MIHSLIANPVGHVKTTTLTLIRQRGIEVSAMKTVPLDDICAAIADGKIDGEVYGDGEVWANLESLTEWGCELP